MQSLSVSLERMKGGILPFFCYSTNKPLRDKGIGRVTGRTLYVKKCLDILILLKISLNVVKEHK